MFGWGKSKQKDAPAAGAARPDRSASEELKRLNHAQYFS